MPQRSVVTIGNFDGVHVGHRAILARARDLAQGAPVVAMTFDPHPASVLRPGTQPPRLMSREQKIAALKSAGADEVVVLEPRLDLLALTPQQFIQQVVHRHHPRAIVEGPDFRFGRRRQGDVQTLRELGHAHDFKVIVVPPVDVVLDDLSVVSSSSSLARWLAEQGRVVDVARCLGQPLAIEGRVVLGERRGRQLGCPTANIDPAALIDRALPADGVYAGLVLLDDGQSRPAAVSMGTKPTFANRPRTLEAHLLDFNGDLYDRPICVRFTRWLRNQESYPSVDLLKQQIDRDILDVRRLAQHGALPAQQGMQL